MLHISNNEMFFCHLMFLAHNKNSHFKGGKYFTFIQRNLEQISNIYMGPSISDKYCIATWWYINIDIKIILLFLLKVEIVLQVLFNLH